MAGKRSWFDVDPEGLRKLIDNRGKAFAIFELKQNSWDEPGVTRSTTTIKKHVGRPKASIIVEDDAPGGFVDCVGKSTLHHASTFFAESKKKGNPALRGRFNLGEKLVLALCDQAKIETTTGTVIFNSAGRRESRAKTERGTIFSADIRMTEAEYAEVCQKMRTLLPPEGIEVSFNGEPIPYRKPTKVIEEPLPTEISDKEGNLKRTIRKTKVHIHLPLEGELATIYEMGIPVVALDGGDKYHIDIQQKVPLNMDRDNVNEAYKAELRKIVLNAMAFDLSPEDADRVWVSDGAGRSGITKGAAERVVKLQYGDKYLAADPRDPESQEKAITKGYSVIPSRGISGAQRERLKEFGLIQSTSKLFATPKPFSDDPEAPEAEFYAEGDLTEGMKNIRSYTKYLSLAIAGAENISVRFCKSMGSSAALINKREIIFNVGDLGIRWFDGIHKETNRLIIHELAHLSSSSHFHEDYRRALERLWSNLVEKILREPGSFDKFGLFCNNK